MNFVEWIQLGFHGFAFALFYLSMREFSRITKASEKIRADIDVEAATILLRKQSTSLRYLVIFALISFMFFVGGVIAQITAGQLTQDISVFIEPPMQGFDIPEEADVLPPTLHHQNAEHSGIGPGQNKYDVAVGDGHIISVGLYGIEKYIGVLHDMNDHLLNENDRLTAQSSITSNAHNRLEVGD